MEIKLNYFLSFSAVLFTIGIGGVFINRKSIINILLSIELLLLATIINLVAFSSFRNDIIGQIFAMFVLTVAGAESGIGLAILVLYYRNSGNIDIEKANLMKK